MKTEELRESIVRYFKENESIGWLMNAAPFILFMGPVQGFMSVIISRSFDHLQAVCQILSLIGLVLCIAGLRMYPVIAACSLKIICELCEVFTRRASFNTIVYIALAVVILVFCAMKANAVGNFSSRMRESEIRRAEEMRARQAHNFQNYGGYNAPPAQPQYQQPQYQPPQYQQPVQYPAQPAPYQPLPQNVQQSAPQWDDGPITIQPDQTSPGEEQRPPDGGNI